MRSVGNMLTSSSEKLHFRVLSEWWCRPSIVPTITTRILGTVRWGMIGCGEVAEVTSGPGFQKANGSVLSPSCGDRVKAEDFANRHGIPRVHSQADALIDDPEVDAVYVATPPGLRTIGARFHAFKVRELLDSGVIGRLTSVHVRVH